MTIIKAGTARQVRSSPDDAHGPYRAILISDTGDLTQFGAFIEVLSPGARASDPHWHATEDEMILLLAGELTVVEDGTEALLLPGDAACWRAGDPAAHTIRNDGIEDARYVVIGTRSPRDVISYPENDRVLHFDRTTGSRRYTDLAGKPTKT
jgi:uncharacterized cupin superfamily protein